MSTNQSTARPPPQTAPLAAAAGTSKEWTNCEAAVRGLLGDYSGTTLGLLWDYFGTTLGLLWDYFGTTLGLLGDYLM